MASLNTLGMAHDFLARHVRPGDFCIDATVGRGGDAEFLCSLVGPQGRVLAFDIQAEAVESTSSRLHAAGYGAIARVIHDSHSNLHLYARDGEADCVVFNLGWLPGGDHRVFTRAETSIPAVEQGLRILRPGGVMCLCVYYGGRSGFAERDALLEYLRGVDHRRYTVLLGEFLNRPNNPPMPVFIWKDEAAQ